MKRIRTKKESLENQIKSHSKPQPKQKKEYDGNLETMVSTGSTLLDLAISGGRVRGGGIPGGIFVEVFGPSSAGKTVLLCEIAGAIQRMGGSVRFDDPEARLNKTFASLFGLRTDEIEYAMPDKVTEVFASIRKWEPTGKGKIHGTFTDSLAALSTDLEMENEEGDKMGQRRAKEFSEGLRKNARILQQKNYLMVASNQVRENQDAGKYGVKYKSTGGHAIGFYASLRLRASNPEKIKIKEKIAGKEVTRVIGVCTEFEVFKSSIWKPYRTAPVTILFDYGIDDVRENLQFIKDFTKNTMYTVNGVKMDISMEKSIRMVEKTNLIDDLRNEVIDLWHEIESKFEMERKPKQR
jgi:recombination protein RecA